MQNIPACNVTAGVNLSLELVAPHLERTPACCVISLIKCLLSVSTFAVFFSNRSQFGPGGEGLHHEHGGRGHEGLLLRAT